MTTQGRRDEREVETQPAFLADKTDGSAVGRRGLAARSRLAGQASRFTGFVLWGIFILAFALWIPETFLTSTTFTSIASDQAVTVILAVGLLFTLATGQYDLSAAQNLGLSAVIDGYLMVNAHVSPALAAVVTVLIGAVIGLINGVLVAVVGINSFIATLGMSSVLLAMTELISGNQFIGPVSNSFQQIASPRPLGLPALAWYALAISLVAWYVIEHTPMGRRIQATGANMDAAKLAGVAVNRYVVGSFITTGTVAALAGVFVTAQVGEVSPSLGPPYLLPVFAATFLGTTQIKVGRFNVWGTVVSIYLLATGVKGLQLIGSQLWVTDLFNGLALVVAVGVAVTAQRRRIGTGRTRAGARAKHQRIVPDRDPA
jgi:ribose transport system permease protein